MKLSDFGSHSEVKQEDIVKKYNELKDLSSDELSKRLIDEVARQKNDGTFDYNKLLTTIESMRGMIPQQTYINMKRIIENFK